MFLEDDFTYEELLDAAANKVRGRRMTKEEWEHHRDLWAGLGVTLAPCAPPGTAPDTISPVDEDTKTVEDDAYDRAMKGFE